MFMKKYLNLIALTMLLMGSISFVSCSDNDDPKTTETLDFKFRDYYSVPCDGTTLSFSLGKAKASDVALHVNADWDIPTAVSTGADDTQLLITIGKNDGFGRVAQVELAVKDAKYAINIWQEPRQFRNLETFEDCEGQLGVMLGSDPENIKRICAIYFMGSLNANDLSWLRKRLNEAWSGTTDEGILTIEMTYTPLSKSQASAYEGYGLPELEAADMLSMSEDNQLPSNLFKNQQYLWRVGLYEGLTEIGENAFEGCANLQSVNLPSQLMTIGAGAFKDCAKLQFVAFPNDGPSGIYPHANLQTIGAEAFSNVGTLHYFVIPESLKSVGQMALGFKVKDLFVMSPEPPAWAESSDAADAIGPFAEGCILHVPCGSLAAYQASQKWNAFHTMVELPEDSTIKPQ